MTDADYIARDEQLNTDVQFLNAGFFILIHSTNKKAVQS